MRRVSFLVMFGLAACGGGEIEIAGTWDTQFQTVETISSEKWNTATVVDFDNDGNTAITQSPADDMYTPNKFAKVVWLEPAGNSFYYCTVDYGRDTLEAAKTSTKTAEGTNPDATGCGGFPWSKLTKKQ